MDSTAARSMVIKGVVGPVVDEYRDAPDLATRVTNAVAEALAELDGPVRAATLAEAISVAQSAPTPDCSNFSSLNDAFNGGQNVAVQAIRELAGDVDEDSCATCSHTDDYHYPDCMHIACDCGGFVRRDAA